MAASWSVTLASLATVSLGVLAAVYYIYRSRIGKEKLEEGSGARKMPAPVNKSLSGPVEESQVADLVGLLQVDDIVDLRRVVVTISNLAAFSVNQELFCRLGAVEKLVKLLDVMDSQLQDAATLALANLSLCQNGLPVFQACDCVESLGRLLKDEETPPRSQLVVLRALTNLSVTPLMHQSYIPLLPNLTLLIGSHTPRDTQMQALRVLVNLSTNPLMLADLLLCKPPGSLHNWLDLADEDPLLLRKLTLLDNMMDASSKVTVSQARLYNMADHQRTLHFLLFIDQMHKLRSHIISLVWADNQEIQDRAQKVVHHLDPSIEF